MPNRLISQTGNEVNQLNDDVMLESEDAANTSGHFRLSTLVTYLRTALRVGQASGLAQLDANATLKPEQLPLSQRVEWLRGSYNGKPPESTIFLQIASGLVLSLEQNLAGSRIVCRTAATLPMTFTLAVNNVAKGTVRFDADANEAVITTPGAIGLTAADVLSLVSPAAQDATLSDICVAICAKYA